MSEMATRRVSLRGDRSIKLIIEQQLKGAEAISNMRWPRGEQKS